MMWLVRGGCHRAVIDTGCIGNMRCPTASCEVRRCMRHAVANYSGVDVLDSSYEI